MGRAKAHAESRDMFDFMETTRGIKGVREDDENGLVDMLMELMGAGGPVRGQFDDDKDDDEDDSEVSEEEYVLHDEWTDWTPPTGNE